VQANNNRVNTNLQTLADLYWWYYHTVAKLSADNYLGFQDSISGALYNFPHGMVVTGRENALDILDRIATGSGTFVAPTRLGKMFVGTVRTNPLDVGGGSTFDTPVISLTDADFIADDAVVTRLEPKYSILYGWSGLNYPPLSRTFVTCSSGGGRILRF
jgi:hypothetical protein